jgi:hypothetical protein
VRSANGTATSDFSWLVTDYHQISLVAVDAATLQATTRYTKPFGDPRGTPAATWPDNHGFLGKPEDKDTGSDPTGLMNDTVGDSGGSSSGGSTEPRRALTPRPATTTTRATTAAPTTTTKTTTRARFRLAGSRSASMTPRTRWTTPTSGPKNTPPPLAPPSLSALQSSALPRSAGRQQASVA